MTKNALPSISSPCIHKGWGSLMRQASLACRIHDVDCFPATDNSEKLTRLDLDTMRHLSHHLNQEAKDPLFTVKASQWVSALTFDSYSLTLWTAPNLDTLLQDASNFSAVLCSSARLTYQKKASGDVELCIINTQPSHRINPDTEVGLSLYLASVVQIIQKTAPGKITNLEVKLSASPYSQKVKCFLEQELNCNVLLGSPLCTVTVNQHDLDKVPETSHPEIYQSSRAMLRKQQAQVETEDPVLQIYNVLDHLPNLANISGEVISAQMLVSLRTLNRRLAGVGLNYRTVIENYKLEKAIQLLNQPGINMTEIAFQLGFSDLSAFSRAFKRWTGATPSNFD